MNHRILGKTGLEISEIGFGGAPAGLRNYLGVWEPQDEESARQIETAITRAFDLGITYFDTAPGYGDGASERMFGRAIRPFRERVVLATKLLAANSDEVKQSVDASLERLQVEWIDVLQIHGAWYRDEEVDRILAPGGVLNGLQAVKDQGLVRWIGFTTEGINGATDRLIACGAFDVMQICYNLIHQHPYDPVRKAGALYDAEAQGMGVVTMRTLTSGILQKWMGAIYGAQVSGHEWQARTNQALLSFVLSNPLVDCALVGMRTPQEVEANVAACENMAFRMDLNWLHDRYGSNKHAHSRPI